MRQAISPPPSARGARPADSALHFYQRAGEGKENRAISQPKRAVCPQSFIPGAVLVQSRSQNENSPTTERQSSTNSDCIDSAEAAQAAKVMNMIAGLRKELSGKELEVLSLKNEQMKAETATEDCRRELRGRTKELESLRAVLSDQHLCRSCAALLRPFVRG